MRGAARSSLLAGARRRRLAGRPGGRLARALRPCRPPRGHGDDRARSRRGAPRSSRCCRAGVRRRGREGARDAAARSRPRSRIRAGPPTSSSTTSRRPSTRRPAITVFDFRTIRQDRDRWGELLDVISGRERGARRAHVRPRARAAPRGPARVREAHGLHSRSVCAGRADHIAVPAPEGSGWSVVVDLSRALADVAVVAADRAGLAPLAPDGRGGLSARLGGVPGGQSRLAAAARQPRPARAPAAPRSPRRGRSRSTAWTRTSFRSSIWLKQSMQREPRRVESRGRPARVGRGRARGAHGHRRRDPEAGVHGEHRGPLRRLSGGRDHPGRSAWTPTARRWPAVPSPSSSPTGRRRTRRAAG